jgi:Resolvase, N terminal domain
MHSRPTAGRGLFYTRDSGGKHETTPGQYVRWACQKAEQLSVRFDGTPGRIDEMIRSAQSRNGDLFLDYGIQGHRLSRPGLDALFDEVRRDFTISHIFIPRRDRLARPNDPIDGMQLELKLQNEGVTLIFMDRVVPPRRVGDRGDIGEKILSLVDYDRAGRDRQDLAQKVIYAQIALARGGFSTGGRSPYAFRRWLVTDDGKVVRELPEGEYVKRKGHHVVWVPVPETHPEWQVTKRILSLLPTMPASRVAAILTSERIPSPDAGRMRTDNGVRHATSGVWHQTTIVNIARNPLLLAVVTHGRRSMGDQLRWSPDGPRPLNDSDFREKDGKPKVVAIHPSAQITAPARFDPRVDEAEHRELIRTLDERAGTQRGKPRSKDPSRNPLGTRVFDACGWPMYRQPYNGSFRYLCGLYQQSHAAQCRHNVVDGVQATAFLLSCVRQRLARPDFRSKLEEKLRAIAERECGDGRTGMELEAKRAELAGLQKNKETAARNMTLASDPQQFGAMQVVFNELLQKERQLREELKQAERAPVPELAIDAEVGAALQMLDRLTELAGASDLQAVGQLFERLNARLFLRFAEVPLKKRKVNKVAGGVVTFGAAPPPVPLYSGPTDRRALCAKPPSTDDGRDGILRPRVSVRKGKSLGNVSRGERI